MTRPQVVRDVRATLNRTVDYPQVQHLTTQRLQCPIGLTGFIDLRCKDGAVEVPL